MFNVADGKKLEDAIETRIDRGNLEEIEICMKDNMIPRLRDGRGMDGMVRSWAQMACR